MKCPTCQSSDLVLSERLGVEIDYCPKCRGVWLDRGELDKIIDRSDKDDNDRAPLRDPRSGPVYTDDDDHDDRGMERDGHYPAKKRSFWSELFD